MAKGGLDRKDNYARAILSYRGLVYPVFCLLLASCLETEPINTEVHEKEERLAEVPTVNFSSSTQSSSLQSASSVISQSVSENVGVVIVPITLSNAYKDMLQIPYTVSGTAAPGADHDLSDGSITIEAEKTEGVLIFSVISDDVCEAVPETIIITLASASDSTGDFNLGKTVTYTVTISDVATTPQVNFSSSSQNASEEAGSVNVGVSLSAPTILDVSVPLSFSGTATDADYTVSSTTLTIEACESVAHTTVTLTDDTAEEDTETVIIAMGTPTRATKGAVDTQSVNITNNDTTVSFTSSAQSVAEAAGTVTVTASLSKAVDQAVSVPFTVSGAATQGVDHNLSNGTITIPAGSTTANLSLNVLADGICESSSETITITMGTPTNAAKGATSVHTITIAADAATTPSVSFSASEQSVNENVGTATVTAALSAVTSQDVVVAYTVSGNATSGSDYSGLSNGTITIPACSSSANKSFTITNDLDYEASVETVILTMGSLAGATQGAFTTHTVSITSDDACTWTYGDPIMIYSSKTKWDGSNNEISSNSYNLWAANFSTNERTLITNPKDEDYKEKTIIAAVDDDGGSLNNQYFFLNAPSSNGYYFWFDVDDTGIDPGPFDSRTGVEMDIVTGENSGSIASAIQSTVDGLPEYSTTRDGSTVTVIGSAIGDVTDASASDGLKALGFATRTSGEWNMSVSLSSDGSKMLYWSNHETRDDYPKTYNIQTMDLSDIWTAPLIERPSSIKLTQHLTVDLSGGIMQLLMTLVTGDPYVPPVYYATYSPVDDKKIGFSSNAALSGGYNAAANSSENIWLLLLNNSGALAQRIPLTKNTASGTSSYLPVWSPDGSKIYFTSQMPLSRECANEDECSDSNTNWTTQGLNNVLLANFWMIELNSSNYVIQRKALTRGGNFTGIPQFNSDGTKILVTSSMPLDAESVDYAWNDSGKTNLWLMDADGTNRRALTRTTSPNQTPSAALGKFPNADDTKIVFMSDIDFNTLECSSTSTACSDLSLEAWQGTKVNGLNIWVMQLDGNYNVISMKAYTRNDATGVSSFLGSYSPDGTMISFTSNMSAGLECPGETYNACQSQIWDTANSGLGYNLWTMDSDGSNLSHFTSVTDPGLGAGGFAAWHQSYTCQ